MKGNFVRKDGIYLIFLLAFGCVYFAVSGSLGIYAEPLQRAGGWCMALLGQTSSAEQAKQDGESGNAVGNGKETENLSGADEVKAENGVDDDFLKDEPAKDGAEGAEAVLEEGGQASGEIVYQTVDDDYFADALFIGDSRTVGMYEYGELEEISTFYASTGLTVYKMFSANVVKVPGQMKKQTIEEALSERQFAKIYLMVGINEMGVGTVETFIEKYRECVEHLQELQPDAVIYLQGIMKVTVKRSEQGDYITNEGIEERNEEIAKLANGKDIFYLDVNPLVCDETGGMTESYTYDGVHLKAQYIPIWKEFLKTHVVK